MDSNKKIARMAGLLYLLNGITSGFAFAYVLGKVYVAGNASATAANVISNSVLLRAGVVADLFQATIWIFLALTLYILLKHASQNAARTMVILVAVGAAIVCLNDVFQFESVVVATNANYFTALGAAGTNALVLMLLQLHHYGFLIAQIFFGLWLVPLGYLAYKSRMFPKWLGALLIIGGVCYLIGLVAVFLSPASGEKINTLITIPSAVAEISMVFYLLIIGVRTLEPGQALPIASS